MMLYREMIKQKVVAKNLEKSKLLLETYLLRTSFYFVGLGAPLLLYLYDLSFCFRNSSSLSQTVWWTIIHQPNCVNFRGL
jgi:hypothetical protein